MKTVVSRGTLVKLMLAIGILQMAAYYLAGAMVRSDGGMAIPQPDSLLYCQAARRVAEGYPLSFSPGTAVSTGTTSHLYPFVLAVPYLLGCRGDSLIRAGFFLNGLFYLVFLLGWALVIDRRLKGAFPRVVAALSVAFLGQTAYSAFAQSDIGIWLAVSGLFAAGLVLEKRVLYGSVLVIAPWVRPEGMVCAIAFALALGAWSLLRRIRGGDCARREGGASRADVVIAALALLSSAGVFALNLAVSGQLQFASLAHKGYFKTLPFANAVFATTIDCLKLAKGILLGLPDGSPRDFYTIPLLGAALMWCAVFARDWRREGWRSFAWLLAVVGGILTVAQSGWQNTNVDRYIGWTLPTVAVFVAEGAGWFAERFSGSAAARLPGVLVCLFAVGTAPVFACMLHMTSFESDLQRAFAVECGRTMEKGESVGSWGDCGIVYEMDGRRMAHLGGIYSPEFTVDEPPSAVYEILKHEPDSRFRYLFCNPAVDHAALQFNPLDAYCSQVLVGPFGYELREMDWTSFDAAAKEPKSKPEGMSVVDGVDVGYERAERAHGYEVLPRFDQPPLPPFVVWGENGGVKMIEAARLVVGGDAMEVKTSPGRDLAVVMRLWPSHKATLRGGFGSRAVTYAFSSPLKVRAFVDGADAGVFEVTLAEKGFTDAVLTIPGALVSGGTMHLELAGDRIVCAYWFCQ